MTKAVCLVCQSKGTGSICTGINLNVDSGSADSVSCSLWGDLDLREKMPTNDELKAKINKKLAPKDKTLDFDKSDLVIIE